MDVWRTLSASLLNLCADVPLLIFSPNVEGGIFWSYGLVTFARYLGWYSELGWSWNRAPSSGYPTAEFVESFLIFLYGATNTWMER
jgi:hypothetical protein